MKKHERHCFLSGVCPDEHCQTKLYFPSYDRTVECTSCGQVHECRSLRSVAEVTDPDVVIHNMVRNLLMGNLAPKKTTDSIKVLGLSNYHCKLLSPLLTNFGMDKDGNAQPLECLTKDKSKIFNCANLGGRAFLIQPEHIDIMGYGRDQTGSAHYLCNTLEQIKQVNRDEEVLIPIHADGDGHCLVHGISRALVGRELFWHALRTNLKNHFEENLDRYKNMFRDFVDNSEWPQIIAESDPDYLPGPNEAMGLQNIHIFGLANILRRPIVLLDSLSGLESFGDYSGVFLPVLSTPAECSGKDGKLNKPLCVAWSSSGRNHFIALVGVKGRPLPRLPRWMLSKAWGTSQEEVNRYIEFDGDNMCTVGGDRALTENYVQRLVTAMEDEFKKKHGVHPSLVSDVYNFISKRTGIGGIHQNVIIEHTRASVQDHQLYRCLICSAVSQVPYPQGYNGSPSGLKEGGELYVLAKQTHGTLQEGRVYDFPTQDIQCTYDASSDELIPDHTFNQDATCPWCKGKQLRRVKTDGSIVYMNGDRTSAASSSTTCTCGHKHFWDGVEYDNPPKIFKVPLVWKGKTIEEEVVWFQNEPDPSLNSNAFKLAESLVNKHYPGEFGNEQLVQKVVESILHNTASREAAYQPPSLSDMPGPSTSSTAKPEEASRSSGEKSEGVESLPNEGRDSPRKQLGMKKKEGSAASSSSMNSPSKIILSGGSKSLHKEELTMSETEKALRKKIAKNAPQNQQQKSLQQTADRSNQSSSSSGVGEMKFVAMETVSSRTIEPPSDIRIKLSSSEGKHTTLVLAGSTTYSQLQTLIESKFHIAPAKQRIKYGFPPKELRAPPSGEEGSSLPLRNGDKVTVEVIQDITRADPHYMASGIAATKQKRFSEQGLNQGALLKEFQKDINKMRDSDESNLEVQLTSHTLMAALNGLDLWNYSKRKPELFSRGGLFYNIVERDLGLEDGKHCMLPSIPKKRFRFSQPNDRLELCLEPLGHFPVSSEVDDLEKFKDVALGQRSLEMSESEVELEASSSGYVAFAGRGHSLSVDGGATAADGATASKKYPKFGGDCGGDGKQGLEVAMDQVQYEESHIPSQSGHPYGGMDESVLKQEQCVEMEHSKDGAGIQRGEGEGMTEGGKGEREIPMDVEDEAVETSKPTPMEVDSSNQSMPEPFNQSQTASMVAELRRSTTEPVIGAISQEAAINRTASEPSSQLPLNSPNITAELPASSSSQGAANTKPSQGDINPSDSVIGSEGKDNRETANEDCSYVSRRLGPGYTVLVKREDEDKS
ncbi:deubiquitinating protein VCPIP1-like isoform X1 [Lytechinus variegatus]|uniref:deubiquitinating protein VCPIP1-like isoform X1 n=1 Tax=Lytechinus variegatus TaxID=7654 RepID=UPI001BB160E9|nr:deubiquitinating protein VCPIP1-like isoform X1 [Lytechinus variegatus]